MPGSHLPVQQNQSLQRAKAHAHTVKPPQPKLLQEMHSLYRHLLAFIGAFSLVTSSFAEQAGELDVLFQADPKEFELPGISDTGSSFFVTDLLAQPDMKIIVAGKVSGAKWGSKAVPLLKRFLPDGTRDDSFNPPSLFVTFIGYQPGGTLVVHAKGGLIGTTQTETEAGLMRLRQDGTRDSHFAFNAPTAAVDVLPDGKILVIAQAANAQWEVIRLNADGTADGSFNAFTTSATGLASMPDGKVLLFGGGGQTVQLSPGGEFLRFLPGAGAVLPTPSGKMLFLNRWDPDTRTWIYDLYRLNSDGTMDPSFSRGVDLRNLHIQADGKILGIYGDKVYRLNTNGAIDSSFSSAYAPRVERVHSQQEGKILIAGQLSVNGIRRPYLAQLFGDPNADPGSVALRDDAILLSENDPEIHIAIAYTGALDRPFFVSLTVSGSAEGGLDFASIPETLIFHPGETEKVLRVQIYEDFTRETTENLVITLSSATEGVVIAPERSVKVTIADADGAAEVDTRFQSSALPGTVARIVALPNAELLVGTISPLQVSLVRASGKAEPLLKEAITSGTLNDIALLAGGEILVTGAFSTSQSIVRFTSTGHLDETFSSPMAFADDILIQPSGDILIRGAKASEAPSVHRLNADGSIDPNFHLDLDAATAEIRNAALDSLGRILVVGQFESVNNVPRTNIARLSPDGSVDLTFNPAEAPVSPEGARAVLVDNDDSLLVVQSTSYDNNLYVRSLTWLNNDGTLRTQLEHAFGYPFEDIPPILVNHGAFVDNRMIRYNPDGSKDASFAFPAPPEIWDPIRGSHKVGQAMGTVRTDGKIAVSSGLSPVEYPPLHRDRIILLRGRAEIELSISARLPGGSSGLAVRTTDAMDFLLESSLDLTTWRLVSSVRTAADETQILLFPLDANQEFFRVRTAGSN